MPSGHLGQLYFGAALTDREDFTHLCERGHRDMAPVLFDGDTTFSLEHLKQEYPSFGKGDMRYLAFEIRRENGSTVSDFRYARYQIRKGKQPLLRPETTEQTGEVIGLSLVYSDNFLGQVEVDTMGTARVMMGIHPQNFAWPLQKGETFQTPEAVMVYTKNGLNSMSQTFHRLYRTRLARGSWRDRERPILINNWEATYMTFDEGKILSIAKKAKELGIEIQYGSSYVYPLSSISSHVSAVPNHQTFRSVPLETRAAVACFGAFGYELDLNLLSEEEQEQVKKQVAFVKKYRALIQSGTFYRLKSPFEGSKTDAAWMVVSKDRSFAIFAYYRIWQPSNNGYNRVRLEGLDPEIRYEISDRDYFCYGDELMEAGLILSDYANGVRTSPVSQGDGQARIILLKRQN